MIPNADQVANAPEARLYSSDVAIWEAVVAGYFVRSGCAVTAGSGLSVNVAAGIVYNNKNSITTGAVANLTLGSAPSGSNYRWTLIEVDSTGAVSIHDGTDAVIGSVEPPTPTAGRTVLAAILIPNGATVVEVFSAGANTAAKAQIIDKRQTGQLGAYNFATDTARTVLTANTAPWSTGGTVMASILGATVPVVANSLQVGDIFRIRASLRTNNNIAASALLAQIVLGGVTCGIPSTGLLGTSGSGRQHDFECDLVVASIGSGTATHVNFRAALLASAPLTSVGEFNVAGDGVSSNQSSGFDSTAAQVIDFQVKYGASSTAATATLDHFSIEKIPA